MLKAYTPHDIVILDPAYGIEQDPKTKQFLGDKTKIKIIATIVAEKRPLPRVAMANTPDGAIENVPIEKVTYGAIENLPPSDGETIFIVSGLTAAAAAREGRTDVLAPGAIVKDLENPSNVLGALFLQRP